MEQEPPCDIMSIRGPAAECRQMGEGAGWGKEGNEGRETGKINKNVKIGTFYSKLIPEGIYTRE